MSLIKMLVKWHIFVFVLLAILTRNRRILKGYVGIHLIGAAILAVLWYLIRMKIRVSNEEDTSTFSKLLEKHWI